MPDTLPSSSGVEGLDLLIQASLMLGLAVLSGAFSGSETVLFSLSRVQLDENAASANPLRRRAARLMRHPERTLLVILLANTAVNVLLFATSYVLSRDLEPQAGAWVTPVIAVVSILLVMVCGEVVPKVVATSMANTFAPFSAGLVQFVGIVVGCFAIECRSAFCTVF